MNKIKEMFANDGKIVSYSHGTKLMLHMLHGEVQWQNDATIDTSIQLCGI